MRRRPVSTVRRAIWILAAGTPFLGWIYFATYMNLAYGGYG